MPFNYANDDLFTMLDEEGAAQDRPATVIMATDVPLKLETEEVRKLHKNTGKDTPNNPKKTKRRKQSNLDLKKTEGTGGTKGTTYGGAASSDSLVKNTEGTGGTFSLDNAVDPLHDAEDNQIKKLSFDDLKMPVFLVEDDWFDLGGKRKPGVWYCYETAGTEKKPPAQLALRICSPLYIDAVTNTEDGQFFGRLLRFRYTLGKWSKWAMPMELLRGACDELRGELLAAGVEIDQKNRVRLSEYLQWKTPKKVITAATRTGWTSKGG